jgi:hypothetical protein
VWVDVRGYRITQIVSLPELASLSVPEEEPGR